MGDTVTGDLFLGLDVGSSSTKAVLVDADGGVVAEARSEHEISRPRPGWAEQDAERRLVGQRRRGVPPPAPGPRRARLRRRRERPRPVRAAGGRGRAAAAARDPVRHRLAGHRPGRAADREARRRRDPRPLRLAALEPVGRTQAPLARRRGAGGVVGDPARLRRELLPRLAPHRRVRARPPQRQPLGAALRRPPERLDRRVGRGRRPGSGAAPAGRGRRTRAASSSREAAAATGLPEGTPVAAGTIDSWCEVVASGLRGPGEGLLVYGTSMFLVEVDSPARSGPAAVEHGRLHPGLAQHRRRGRLGRGAHRVAARAGRRGIGYESSTTRPPRSGPAPAACSRCPTSPASARRCSTPTCAARCSA